MKKSKLIHLKNDMLLANSISNLIGVIFVSTLTRSSATHLPEDIEVSLARGY